MRIFRVCCKLHNYLIQERDPFSGMVGVDDTDGENVAMPTMTGGEPMPPEYHHLAPSKQRRYEWLVALKRAGLARRTRRN